MQANWYADIPTYLSIEQYRSVPTGTGTTVYKVPGCTFIDITDLSLAPGAVGSRH